MNALNISDKAKRVIDFSNIGYECGEFFHPIGNFSIIPYYGIWLASFRRFAYHITTDIQNYVTTPELKLNNPHKQLFCLFGRDFNFIKKLPCEKSDFWEDPKFNRRTPYLEDMRMIEWNGTIYGISSIFYQNEKSYERFGLEV